MYKTFFNLTRNPFDLTPNPVFFVQTGRHNEALASLYEGVRQHRGFVVLSGEVGTGKTLLLRCFLNLLKESHDIAYAYLFNGRLSPTEFLQYILVEFGLPAAGKSKCELLVDLSKYLVRRGEDNLTTVLVIDEAHLLSAEILEEVRLLSNLETADDKLLQIVLAGQPELDEKLDSPALRQLKQRVSRRAQLLPLDRDETTSYIQERLQRAGSPSPLRVFPPQTTDVVYQYSQGLPRVINTICENALITAYANQSQVVTAEIITSVANDFRLGSPMPLQAEPPEVTRDVIVRRPRRFRRQSSFWKARGR